MLISLSVKNFLSFGEEQVFSMIASNKITEHDQQYSLYRGKSDLKLLHTAAVYGANASGKSNFVEVFGFLQDLVIEPLDKNSAISWEPHRFGNYQKQNGEIEITFLSNKKIYTYGLIINKESIVEEWLLEGEGESPNVLYERYTSEASDQAQVEIKLNPNIENKKIAALSVVGCPPKSTFLATVYNNYVFSDSDSETESPLLDVILWFDQILKVVTPDVKYMGLLEALYTNEEFKNFATSFLNSVSTGIDKIEVTEVEISEVQAKDYIATLKLSEFKNKDGSFRYYNSSIAEHAQIILKNKKYISRRITTIHNEESFVFAEESTGTQRLFHLLFALYEVTHNGAVYVFDEIDNCLHPHLTREFVKYYTEQCSGKFQQLIFTTHESNLLDIDLLRRDSIWFSEKNNEGATSLYSLSDFKPRKDAQIQKQYLQGRFGGIPFFGDLHEKF